ncbi:hypothetical protein ACRZ5S_06740 [Vibrio scophthalmi]|uniref:hypothetical protein n=1 Tax=Vibrio scophthalmi TaxID=45658 RepID=UPI003EBAA9E2
MDDNKLNKEEMQAKTEQAKVIAAEKAAQAQEQAKKLKDVVEAGVKAKDPKVLGGLGVAAVLTLFLLFGGGTSLGSVDEKEFNPDYSTNTWMEQDRRLHEQMPGTQIIIFHKDGYSEYSFVTEEIKKKPVAWKVKDREDGKFAIYDPKDESTQYVFSSDSKMCIEIYNQLGRCYKS